MPTGAGSEGIRPATGWDTTGFPYLTRVGVGPDLGGWLAWCPEVGVEAWADTRDEAVRRLHAVVAGAFRGWLRDGRGGPGSWAGAVSCDRETTPAVIDLTPATVGLSPDAVRKLRRYLVDRWWADGGAEAPGAGPAQAGPP
jgi:hypothetical protein